MFVYLIFRGSCKKTNRVSVDLEKCVPCVGTYAEGSIDPALWYKVLALDSILVDCDQRVVLWTCEKYDVDDYGCSPDEELDPDRVRNLFKNKEHLFRENVDFNPTLVELFDTAEGIYHGFDPEAFDRDGQAKDTDLLKLLHVYIFPEVSFRQKHRTVLQQVLHTIEKEYENIEILIAMYVQMKKNCEDMLSKQRRYLLSEDGISSILNNLSSDDDVIKLLFRHTGKDIRKLNDNLIALTHEIRKLETSMTETNVKILANSRAERDRVFKEKESMVLARGELVFGISQRQVKSSRKSKRGTINRPKPVKTDRFSDRFEQYKIKSSELENLNDDIKQHINVKIRMSCVREATSLTLREMETHGSSFGYNKKKGSLEIETDLFDPANKPEDWTTTNELVKLLLKTNKSDLGTRHEQCCTKLKEKCKALQEKVKPNFLINDASLEIGRPAFPSGNDHNESKKLSSQRLFGCLSKGDREAVCKQISEHVTDMADEIAKEIQGNNEITRTFHAQVYICYEEQVSEELMPVLSELYEQEFRIQCENLSVWIEEYSETELDSINKTLESLFPDTIKTESLQQDLNTRFTSAFENFFSTIQKEDTAVSIFSKLRYISNAVQSAQKTVSELRVQNGQNGEICTDDILDILILLICRLDRQNLLKLYAHSNLILDLSPYFLEGNIDEYVLVSLTGAYQHLFMNEELHSTSVQKMCSG